MLNLLRASPLHVVLRRPGLVFENNEGSAETYSLSSQVDHIGSLVSHTWRTPRRQKFMALSLHFGFSPACESSCLIDVVISTLGALRGLFFVKLKSIHVQESVPNCPYGLCLCPLLCWLVLFFQTDLVPPFFHCTRFFWTKCERVGQEQYGPSAVVRGPKRPRPTTVLPSDVDTRLVASQAAADSPQQQTRPQATN